MDYGAIIKRAWHVTWRHKSLWVLGLFAGVSGCQGGGSSGGSGGGRNDWSSLSGGGSRMASDFLETFMRFLPVIIAGTLLLVALGIIWSVLSIAARGGLIAGVNEVEEGRTPRLGALWSAGFGRFWTLVGLGLLLNLPVFVVALLMVAVMFVPIMGALAAGREPGIEMIAPVCGSLVIGIPLLLVMSFVLGIMYLVGQRYVVIGGQGAVESAGNAWRFFRARFKDTALMYLISAALNIVAAVALIIPAVAIGIVVAMPLALGALQESWPTHRRRCRAGNRGVRGARDGVLGDLGHLHLRLVDALLPRGHGRWMRCAPLQAAAPPAPPSPPTAPPPPEPPLVADA